MGPPETRVSQSVRTYPPGVMYEEIYHPCFLWTLGLAPCLMPLVWNYHVRVTDSELAFGYTAKCMQMIVDRSTIISVETIDKINGLCEWGGWGIRKQLPSWETGYISKNGSGIRVVFKNSAGKEVAYTFICDGAETVARILTGESS